MNEFDGRRESRKKRRLSERRRVFGRIGLQHSGGSTSGSIATTNSSNNYQRRLNNTTGSSANDEQLTSSSATYSSSAGSTIGGFLTREDSTIISGGSNSTSYPRSDSPTVTSLDNTKISMKIQFHITVAPDNEPLILDTSMANTFVFPPNSPATPTSPSSPLIIADNSDSPFNKQKSAESIGDHIAAKLNRQNTASTKRRQQLLVMHNQSALDTNQQQKQQQQQNRASMRRHTGVTQSGIDLLDHEGFGEATNKELIQSEDNITTRTPSISDGLTTTTTSKRFDQTVASSSSSQHLLETRQQGARSSTITGGMSDEATIKFLAKQHQTRPTSSSITATTNSPSYRYNQIVQAEQQSLSPLMAQHSLSSSSSIHSSRSHQSSKEHIYFKRDGQRFGHEFTLKLAVNKTYRCLLKVRPLIPLQAISIQGSQVLFADCSQRNVIQQRQQTSSSTGGGRSSFSANLTHRFSPSQSTNLLFSPSSSSTSALNRSWQNIHIDNHNNSKKNTIKSTPQHQHNHRLNHAQTTNNINLRHSILNNNNNNHPVMNLYQQQQNQMLRHFAASHCSSSSSSHLGGQLIYMFDWSANRFEVNKNKNRTQVNTVLKFENGQILTLPLQVKFYQSECKQHLSWGSQLHFIDYDCNINNMGQINIDRIQYY